MTPDDLARIEARAAEANRHPGAIPADYAAHARNDVPALVAALREAWAERDEAEHRRDAWRKAGIALDAEAQVVRAQRDDARAALARVEALCDDNRGLYAYAEHGLVDAVECYRIRAAITGPTPTEGDDA